MLRLSPGCPKGSKTNNLPRGIESIPACTASSQLTQANLAVTPNNSSQGYSSNNVPPDSQYVEYPSTSVDKPGYETSTVLLPGLAASGSSNGGERYVLGPAQMTGHSIASATATQDQTGQWVVDYTLTGPGSSLWDKVAQENFHQLLGIELDGVVYSAPIIQPTRAASPPSTGRARSPAA